MLIEGVLKKSPLNT